MSTASQSIGSIRRLVLTVFVVFALIQLIPYGRNHTNPPVLQEPPWDSPATRETFLRVCGNCHSNRTVWPWYGSIAPFSWLVQYDVDQARENLNVTEWGRKKYKGDEAADEVREGDMPPLYYKPLHPESWLGDKERREFVAGLVKTFGDRSAEKQGGR